MGRLRREGNTIALWRFELNGEMGGSGWKFKRLLGRGWGVAAVGGQGYGAGGAAGHWFVGWVERKRYPSGLGLNTAPKLMA